MVEGVNDVTRSYIRKGKTTQRKGRKILNVALIKIIIIINEV